MTDFGALVRSGSVPHIDGLFQVDGTVRRVGYDGPRLSRFEVGLPFVPTWREHPDGLVDIDWADRAAMPAGQGYVCCGAGPMGADGFFARLDPDGVPVWVVFLTDSNPFLQARTDGAVATFTNNLQRSLVIDLKLPYFALNP